VSGYLLDTNALLILTLESDTAPAGLHAAFASRDRYVSQVSAIEMAIKQSIGKLRLPPPFQTSFAYAFVEAANVLSAEVLSVEMEHIDALSHLPLHHRDPFDRLIIAQALAENLTVVTRDRSFALYPGLDVYEI
jgi:PIN domain nuclease of toxin-antitoxin system